MKKVCDLNNPAPGAYSHVPNEAYHAAPGISASNLKAILKSPLHAYYKKWIAKHEPSAAMRIGDVTHILTFQPQLRKELIGVQPKIDRRSNAGKAAYAEWQKKSESYQVVVTEDEMDVAQKMSENIKSSKSGSEILGMVDFTEVSIWDKDKDTGLLVKARPDVISRAGAAIIDLKTTRDASPEGFMRQADNLSYCLQAHGQIDLTKKYICPVETYIYLCVESEPPYAVGCYYAKPEYLEEGKQRWNEAVMQWAECAESGKWPSYSEDILPLGIPPWVKSKRRSK